MLILGHAGITLGAAVILSGAVSAANPPQSPPPSDTPKNKPARWLDSLSRRIDIRFLLFGALLPDIIDKPLGHIFFRETLSNGRTFSHTLLFIILIAIAGLFIYRHSKNSWLLATAFGASAHLVLDRMWNNPETLLWPLFGFSFEKHDVTDYIPGIIDSLATKPGYYVPEIIGGLVLVWFAWEVLRRRRLLSFIKHGFI